MVFHFKWMTLPILMVFVSGCSSLPSLSGSEQEKGIDGAFCKGSVPAVLSGLDPISHPELLNKAQLKSGQGGVCAAKAFVVKQPITVYRVYEAEKPWSAYGSWWAMTRPQRNSRESYREKNAICPEWSALNRLIVCQLKVGTPVIIGTTQSARCANGKTYEKTEEIQVYIQQNAPTQQPAVSECQEEGTWP